MRAVVLATLTVPLLMTGCSFAPKYERPPVQTSPAYKELPTAESKDLWKTGQPKDDAIRGPWWQLFNDSELDALE